MLLMEDILLAEPLARNDGFVELCCLLSHLARNDCFVELCCFGGYVGV